MKNLIVLCIGLMGTLFANATTTDDISVLRIDSVALQGNRMAMMAQYIDITSFNRSETDYSGRWFVMAQNTLDGSMTACLDTLITIPSRKNNVTRLMCQLPEGTLRLMVAADPEGLSLLGETMVTIEPLRPICLQTSLLLNMLAVGSEQSILYSDKLHGMVSITNYDTPYYGVSGGNGDDGIVLWLEDWTDAPERVLSLHLADNLPYGNITRDFYCEHILQAGRNYKLKVGYGIPDGMETADSLCFTVQTGTNTYWTVDGQVLPLPQEGRQQLLVPDDAVAVDLRGQHAMNTVFTINASEASPNCLFYLDSEDNIPDGLENTRNVIRGLNAESIQIVDGCDFYCPQAFKAQYISYLLKPSYDNPSDEELSSGYTETIVLPFGVSHALLCDINNDSTSLYADMVKVLEYVGHYADTLTVKEVKIREMMPYVPYILGAYVGSRLLFIGENKVVPMTRRAVSQGNGLSFIGTTVAKTLASVYHYSTSDKCFCFSNTENRIAPFRAYIQADGEMDNDAYQCLYIDNDLCEGIQSKIDRKPVAPHMTIDRNNGRQTICSITGMCIPVDNLSKGVYIVNGKKVVVK